MTMQLLLLILLVAIGLPLLTSRKKKPRKRSCLENVAPVDVDFDWKTQEPLKVRPFVNKKSFNPSMNLTDFTANDWILIEKTYLQNVQLRREITIKHSDHTVFLNPEKRFVAAFHEFYSLVIHYLTHRYPQYFVPDKHNNVVKNLITEDQIPLDPNIITKDSVLEQDHNRELLLSLARTIEEDFILLHKDAPDEEYIMRCNVSGFPAGFDPKNNFDKPISFIHTPVPQYQKRLKVSMSKYFDRLTTDEAHVRHNWSIQTNANKFTLHSHHGREGETPPPPLRMEDIDFEKGCFLRCERQCFTRLPVLGANLMTIRTYVTPLSEIKHLEGDHVTRELIRGIDSLPEDVAFYKKRGAWGEAVKEYLRS